MPASSDVLPADEASTANETVPDALAEKSEDITNSAEQAVVVENDNEKAVEDFPCLICDFSSNWKKRIKKNTHGKKTLHNRPN